MRTLRYMVLILPVLLLFAGVASADDPPPMYAPPRVIYTPMTGDMVHNGELMYKLGTTGNTLEWKFEADELNDDPTNYTVMIDGNGWVGHVDTPWYDFVPISVNVDGLSFGSHMVHIQVNDSHTIFVQAVPYEKTLELKVVMTLPEPAQTMTTSTMMDVTTEDTTTSMTEDDTMMPENTNLPLQNNVIAPEPQDSYPIRTIILTLVVFLIFLVMRGARLKVSIDL